MSKSILWDKSHIRTEKAREIAEQERASGKWSKVRLVEKVTDYNGVGEECTFHKIRLYYKTDQPCKHENSFVDEICGEEVELCETCFKVLG